jgi:hypothetical protein
MAYLHFIDVWLVLVVFAALSYGETYPWYNPSISFEERVELLVNNMTIEELIPQMIKVIDRFKG